MEHNHKQTRQECAIESLGAPAVPMMSPSIYILDDCYCSSKQSVLEMEVSLQLPYITDGVCIRVQRYRVMSIQHTAVSRGDPETEVGAVHT